MKAPVTVFLIAGILPSVPGAGIYRTVYYLIQGDQTLSTHYLISTLHTAGAIALAIFIWNDLVDFKVGLILACGNMLGAWLGVRFSIKWGAKYIRYLLLVVLVIVAVRLFFS